MKKEIAILWTVLVCALLWGCGGSAPRPAPETEVNTPETETPEPETEAETPEPDISSARDVPVLDETPYPWPSEDAAAAMDARQMAARHYETAVRKIATDNISARALPAAVISPEHDRQLREAWGSGGGPGLMNELIYPAAEKPGGVPEDMEIDGTLQWGEDTAIYGHLRQDLGDNCPQATRIALTAKDGSPLWDVTCSNGTTGYEEAVYAAEKDDRLTVISREDNYDRSDYDPVQTSMYLITMIYDKNGQEIFRNRSSIGDWGVWGGAPINGGHILHCEGILNTADVRFLQKLDDSGDPCGAFTYLSGKNTLYYSDMKEVNKKLYISGYYVPTPAESYGRPEIDGVLAAYEHTSGTDLTDHGPDEQLTRMVRDNYTAFLIQCDPADGDIDAMYTVDGALGAELDGSGDGITWNIEEVAGTYYSPATSSFTIGGASYVFRYHFDGNGTFVSMEETDTMREYRR